MLTSTSFAVVVVDDKCPRLIPSFESFCDVWDSVCLSLLTAMIMIKRHVHIAAFIVHCLFGVR